MLNCPDSTMLGPVPVKVAKPPTEHAYAVPRQSCLPVHTQIGANESGVGTELVDVSVAISKGLRWREVL